MVEVTGSVFINCFYWLTLGHSRGNSLTNPMLITAFVQFQLEGHPEPRGEVESLRSAKLGHL